MSTWVTVHYYHYYQDGFFWLEAAIDGTAFMRLAFDTAEERQEAQDDLLRMMKSLGAKDLVRQ